MAEFCMKLADRVAAVRCLFESTPEYFRKYVTQESADFSLTVTREDIAFEAGEALAEALSEGFRVRNFPEPYLERAAIQRKIALELLRYGTVLFHGSAVAADGACYLFTAKSGTGKSTHTRLWRQLLGERAVMVNDDKPFLRITDSGIWVCGSPWSGKHGLDSNIAVPLQGICLLERGSENRIRPLEEAAIMPLLRTHCPILPTEYGHLAQALSQGTAFWHMTCTKDPAAAQVSYEAMSANL